MTTTPPPEVTRKTVTPKRRALLAMVAALIASFGLAFSPLWQLSLVAGAIAGLLSARMKWGAIMGCLGTALGWLAYMGLMFLISESYALVEQVAGIIFGSTSLGWILILLITLIGGLFGTLGGSIGSGVRILISARKTR